MLVDHRLVGCLEVFGDAHDLAAAGDAEGVGGVVEAGLAAEGLLVGICFAVGDTNVRYVAKVRGVLVGPQDPVVAQLAAVGGD